MESKYTGFPKLGVIFLGGPIGHKDYSILGSILRFPYVGKLANKIGNKRDVGVSACYV